MLTNSIVGSDNNGLDTSQTSRSSRRTTFNFWIETPIDSPVSFISEKTLRNYRLFMLIILIVNEAVYMTSTLFKHMEHHLRYFTCWNQYFVLIFFGFCSFVLPAGKTASNVLRTIQHTLISTSLIVLLGYWLVLFPAKVKGGEYSVSREFYWLWVIRGFFNHLVPQFGKLFFGLIFLGIIIDGFLTKGQYTKLPMLIAPFICIVYSCYNCALALIFDIVPYQTPITDPHSKTPFFPKFQKQLSILQLHSLSAYQEASHLLYIW